MFEFSLFNKFPQLYAQSWCLPNLEPSKIWQTFQIKIYNFTYFIGNIYQTRSILGITPGVAGGSTSSPPTSASNSRRRWKKQTKNISATLMTYVIQSSTRDTRSTLRSTRMVTNWQRIFLGANKNARVFYHPTGAYKYPFYSVFQATHISEHSR